MRGFKGIFLLIITNILIFLTLAITGTILIDVVLPNFGIDLRGSVTTLDFAWAMVFGFGGAFISLFMSKFLAKRGMRMQQITDPSTPKEKVVYNTVAELAQREGIKMPEVWVYWDDVPNAFATGPTRNNAMVAVSSGLAMNLTDEELKAVVAHEVGHINNGDMMATTLLQGLMNTFVYFLARMISRPLMERNYWLGFAVYMALQFMLSILAMIPICWFSRRREFRADAYAADAVGAASMASALQKIEVLAQRTLSSEHREEGMSEDALATMKIHGQSKGFSHLFATHPPTEARIAALRNRK
ncbi:heat shock protein HtpX [Mariprofundus aestuarium]|uniref:Heat shock protein HtpX n=1 Tax=Mariprofundus aestuarium TaxID=1921086 RepID=A0A2K8L679_MARES|nr:protease HtpX [Mariprofundus aestuarium]ATX80464.1 heat shock protein HtpX [Mariprofundus aestuarium]